MKNESVCDTIVRADILRKKDGSAPSADEIWNYSSTGELFMIFEWYAMACKKLGIAPQKKRGAVANGPTTAALRKGAKRPHSKAKS